MDELCPLCLKMGSNRRIKAVQINLEEAVWMCENEECPWPFGHEVPNFLSRKVGEKWAHEWEIYKKVQKRVGPIPVSTELSLYTPPVTPSGDATIKEIVKSDISGETSISDFSSNSDNNLFSSNAIHNDSYAPKTIVRDDCSKGESNDVANVCNKMEENVTTQKSMETRIFGRTSSALQSIFDIDGDELLMNKISIKETCEETKNRELTQKESNVLDVRNSTTIVKSPATVLQEKSEIPSEKIVEATKETIVSDVQNETLTRGIPKIRSISRTNIDFRKIDLQKMLISDKTDTPVRSDAVDIESSMPTEQRSFENNHQCHISRQHTTTITVDGNLPITLSYDIGDLEEKNNVIVPATSTPIREKSNRDLSKSPNLPEDTLIGSTIEVPKIQIRPGVKRRVAVECRKYEKFSFSALKKFVRESKSDEPKIVVDSPTERSNERVKFDEITNVKDDKSMILGSPIEICPSSSILPPDKNPAITNPPVSNQPSESLITMNIDANYSGMSNDHTVETLNLSMVLEDILMEGYHNSTENLNDDWLESFFT